MSKDTLIAFENKQAKNMFYLKSKLNQVCVIALSEW